MTIRRESLSGGQWICCDQKAFIKLQSGKIHFTFNKSTQYNVILRSILFYFLHKHETTKLLQVLIVLKWNPLTVLLAFFFTKIMHCFKVTRMN